MNGEDKPGIFGRRQQMPADNTEQLNELNRRARMLEERHSNLEKRIQVSEQNVLRSSRDIQREIKAINSEVNELKKEISDLKDELRKAISELIGCARKEDVEVLKKYINLWSPVNFVTQNEVEKIIKDILGKNKAKKP